MHIELTPEKLLLNPPGIIALEVSDYSFSVI